MKNPYLDLGTGLIHSHLSFVCGWANCSSADFPVGFSFCVLLFPRNKGYDLSTCLQISRWTGPSAVCFILRGSQNSAATLENLGFHHLCSQTGFLNDEHVLLDILFYILLSPSFLQCHFCFSSPMFKHTNYFFFYFEQNSGLLTKFHIQRPEVSREEPFF